MHLKSITNTFLSKTAVAVLGLLLVVFVSKTFGSMGRGHISLMLSSVAFLQMLMEFGSNSSIINLSYTHDPKLLFKSASVFIVVVAALGMPIALVLDLPYKWAIAPLAILFASVNLLQMLLMGQQALKHRNISLLISPLLLLFGLYITVQIFGADLILYPICLALSLIVAFLITLNWFSKTQMPNQQNEFVFQSIILKQGAWVQGAQLIQFLNYRVNFFLIAWIINEAALGVYNNVIVLCEAVWILGHSIGQILHMKIRNGSDHQQQLHLTIKYIALNVLGSFIMMGVLCLLPAKFWIQLFSSEFSQMAELLPYCMLGVLAFSVSNIINHYLHAKDQFKVIFGINVLGLVSGLLSAYYLLPHFGLKGACWSWGIGLSMAMLAYLSYFVKAFKKA